MKKIFLLLIGAIVCGCSTPESVATKALHEIGDGKYKSDALGISLAKISMNNELFTDRYIESKLGEEFSKYMGISGEDSYSEQRDYYFQTELLFDNVKLVEKKRSSIDLYRYSNWSRIKDTALLRYYEEIADSYEKTLKNPVRLDYVVAGLEYENVPCYDLKFKVDNKYMASVLVIKVPQEGYRVGRVFFDR